jgi:hypothetical protein
MGEMKCPSCGKRVMSIKRMEDLIRVTTSKVLLTHCPCGEAFEIRSPTRNLFKISASSGKSVDLLTNVNEGENSKDTRHG